MRHLGVPSAFTTGRPGLVMSAVKAVYQKICCAIWPWAGTGPDSPKVMPMASLGAYFFIPSTDLVCAEEAAGVGGQGGGGGCVFVVGRGEAPFVDRQAVGRADVGGARHRQPRIGEAPTQRRVFLAVVHVAMDR